MEITIRVEQVKKGATLEQQAFCASRVMPQMNGPPHIAK